MSHCVNPERYAKMSYRRCGQSGVLLPAVSLGLWHNFGDMTPSIAAREMILGAFDMGITHFDIANNYGPLPGAAEECFGRVLHSELPGYRDELFISTKAGYRMWPGPYGEWGSKKQLISSLDQSLKRLNLDYVDLFYHHRPDPNTPLEETAEALEQLLRQGKALYIGLSNYNPEQTEAMLTLLEARGIHCLLHQLRYSLLARDNEPVFEVLNRHGVGSIAFSPLAQGLLSGRYLKDIPADSRAASGSIFLKAESITDEMRVRLKALNAIAEARGQSLSQMALSWVLSRATSVVVGASRLTQLAENAQALQTPDFTSEELEKLDKLLRQS